MSLPRICWRSSLRQPLRFRQPAFRRWMATEVDPLHTQATPNESISTQGESVSAQPEPLPFEDVPVAPEKGAAELPFSYKTLPGVLQVPSLLDPHDGYLAENGVKDLFTPIGFKYAYQDVQEHHLTELNKLYHDTIPTSSTQEMMLRNIIKTHAHNPRSAALYNHASLVWNNTFFFQGLLYGHPNLDPKNTEIPKDLHKGLVRDFFSIDNLKTEFLAHANKMFGPGFVWLAYSQQPYALDGSPNTYGSTRNFRRYFIMSTYGAGTPMWQAQYREQVSSGRVRYEGPARTIAERISMDATLDVTPILGVSTWQHSYIADWEVGGKAKFLEAWWNKINWERVETLAKITLMKKEDIRTLTEATASTTSATTS